MIKLTPRLALCADMCPEGERLIDVGCDHGYLPCELVRRGRVKRALACDLREGPLENARETVEREGLSDRVATVLTDGLSGIELKKGDVISICGMGGDNIFEIISRAEAARELPLLLQPMSRQEQLRRALAENGFEIYEEALAREDRRLYTVMLARRGIYSGGDHFMFSPALEGDPLFPLYIRQMTALVRKRLPAGDREDRRILEILEEYL